MTGHRFVYSVVASALHDAHSVASVTAAVRGLLDELGGSVVDIPDADADRATSPHVYVVATGGTERLLLDAIAAGSGGDTTEPTVLVAHRGHNSLPAALETLAAIQQAGGRGRIVSVTGDVAADRVMLDEAIGDLEAVVAMRSTRLGVIGGPSSWLVASSPDAEVVRRRWGPEVVTVAPTRMIELTRTPVTPTGVLAERFTKVADPVRSTVDRKAVDDAMGVRAALVDVLDHDSLDAVTVRCFDLLGDPGTSGCLALASLNDDGIVAGCEGDVPSALAMLWVRHLLGRPTWMANPASVDVERNQLVLAHCTVAPSMVESFSLDTHFESGMGVGIERAVRCAAGDVDSSRRGRPRRELDRRGRHRRDRRRRRPLSHAGDGVVVERECRGSAHPSAWQSPGAGERPPRTALAELVVDGRRRLTVSGGMR